MGPKLANWPQHSIRPALRNSPSLECGDMSPLLKALTCQRTPKRAAEAYETIPTGRLSSLQEDERRYYATAVVKHTKDRLKLATIEWPKEPLESWRARTENQVPKVMAATDG